MRAVIDIGSNSVRLLLEGSRQKFIQTTKLAEGISLTGYLSNDAMERTLAAIAEFFNIAKNSGAEIIYAFATEAVRASRNGPQFTAKIKELTGLDVDIISGELEARCGFLGAAKDAGASVVFDIGGASVEAARGTAKKIDKALSLPIGIVRLKDMFEGDREKCRSYIKGSLKAFEGFWGEQYIGIGGTFGSAAALISGLKKYDPEKTHGFKLYYEDIARLNDKVWAMSPAERAKKFAVITAPRAQVINYGTQIICGLFEFFKPGHITVSEDDNMEGYLKLKG